MYLYVYIYIQVTQPNRSNFPRPKLLIYRQRITAATAGSSSDGVSHIAGMTVTGTTGGSCWVGMGVSGRVGGQQENPANADNPMA